MKQRISTMSRGLFITFEGTEGGGKSTQVQLLAERLQRKGHACRILREPGGTSIGEEIRHTLKHSSRNQAMTAEAELLLMNASRAQLVREVIRPRLAAGEIVLCDRFFDSTVAYQGYGRNLDLDFVRRVIDFAVGPTRPDRTFLLSVPIDVSEARRDARQRESGQTQRDRMEEADRSFFLRVEEGYSALAVAEPDRIRVVDATRRIAAVQAKIWQEVETLLSERQR